MVYRLKPGTHYTTFKIVTDCEKTGHPTLNDWLSQISSLSVSLAVVEAHTLDDKVKTESHTSRVLTALFFAMLLSPFLVFFPPRAQLSFAVAGLRWYNLDDNDWSEGRLGGKRFESLTLAHYKIICADCDCNCPKIWQDQHRLGPVLKISRDGQIIARIGLKVV